MENQKPTENTVYSELEKEVRRLENIVCREQLWHDTLVNTISNPLFYKDLKGRYLGCNKAFEEFTGIPRSKLIGKTIFDIAPKKLAIKLDSEDRKLFLSPGKQRYECRIKTAQGSSKHVLFDKATLYDPYGNIAGLVGIISDITEQKNAEHLITKLSQMLIQAQERERYMISCELHDTIAQNLSALKLKCLCLFKKQAPSPAIGHHLDEACQLMDQMIQSVRDLSHNLRPSSLDLMGLVHTIERFCEDFSDKYGLPVDFQTAGMKEVTLAGDAEINLYRIVQEGLKNIHKHAQATSAIVRLIGAYPHLILQIEDNGRGFNVKQREQDTLKEKRMGLWSIKTRVNLLHGRMIMESQPGRGTKIIVKLKLRDIPA